MRTQVQLDRETMAHYKLNVSVESEKQVDFAIAVVSVLDANDNAPKFIFPSYSDQFPDLIKNEYIVAISASAHSMTPFFTVKVASLLSSYSILNFEPYYQNFNYYTYRKIVNILITIGIINNNNKHLTLLQI